VGDTEACRSESAGAGPAAPLPGLELGGMTARTALEGDRRAVAEAAVSHLRVQLPAGVAAALPQPRIDAVPPLSVPLPGGAVSVDLRPALRALRGSAAGAELVRVGGVHAAATAVCAAGAPRLEGAWRVGSATVGGRALDVQDPRTETVRLLPAEQLDPSLIDLAEIVAEPAGADGALLRAALRPLLDALPDISVPATVARVDLLPGERVVAGGRLVQRGLRVHVSVLGQDVADVVAGEATAGAGGTGCDGPPVVAGDVADLALRCAGRQLVLVDVLETRGRVRLLGAAAPRWIGRRVAVRLTATGRVVARPRVGRDGLFRATAPLPPAAIRHRSEARYQAAVGRQRSPALKLSRRMLITRTSPTRSGITIRGRVVGPLASPAAPITVMRRLSCERWTVVKRFRPGRDGRFRVSIPLPRGAGTAVVRMRTRVIERAASGRPAPTFTLPRYVAL
jgi:hypothetical protein